MKTKFMQLSTEEKKRIGTAQGLVGPASGRGSRRCRRWAADDMPSARCFDEARHSRGWACPGLAGAADFADFAGISGAAIVAALFPNTEAAVRVFSGARVQ